MFCRSGFASLFVVCVVLPVTGCGGGMDDMPDIGQVTGVVTVDGQPAGDLMVSFQPQAGRPSYATTDASGAYELRYNRDTSGAKLGSNLVTISTATDDGDGAGYGDGNQEENTELIPAKYNTMASENPEMTVEVKSGSNEFNWDLESAK